jgi:hypothetical protein
MSKEPESIPVEVYNTKVAMLEERIAGIAEERDLARHGITDAEDVRVVRALYNGIEVEGDSERPALLDVVSQWREDPSKAPRAVRTLFAGDADGGSTPSGGGDGGGTGSSTLSGGPSGNTGGGVQTSSSVNAQLRQLREQYQATKDPAIAKQIDDVLDSYTKGLTKR